MFSNSEARYRALEDQDELLTIPTRRHRTWSWCGTFLTLALMLSLSTNVLLFYQLHNVPATVQSWRPDLVRSLSQNSIQFNASIKAHSKFVGEGPEVDAEWDRYTRSPWIDGTSVVLGVSEEDIRRSGKRHDEHAPFETTVALGRGNGGGYMATIELFHQMHCLNQLRKTAHIDYYKDKDPFFAAREVVLHTDHCVEILRQVLMCNSDPQLISFHWVEGWNAPVPDFNTWHMCRDPEKVLEWAIENAAPMTHVQPKPVDAIELPDRP